MSADTKYSGSCHCGKVKYDVYLPADPTTWELGRCNCTICHKKGYLSMSPKDINTFEFTVEEAELELLGDYTFGTGAMHHRFCKNCGTSVFARGYIAAASGDLVMINVLTLNNVDLSKMKPKKYWNGRAVNYDEGLAEWTVAGEPFAPGQW